jgi:hypothetical protein
VILAVFFLAMPGSAFSKSSKNKAACQKWCEAEDDCVFCDSNAFCKKGDYDARDYDPIKSFKKGTGNWYACGLSEYGKASKENADNCLAWCKNSDFYVYDPCVKCSSRPGCGTGFKILEKFSDNKKGKTWRACAPRNVRKECESYCKRTNECEFCSQLAGCGKGYTSMKTFRGLPDLEYNNVAMIIMTRLRRIPHHYKKNSYACKKRNLEE